MNFGKAIESLKQGKKVAREGWNGKNMFVALMPGMKLHSKNSGKIPCVNDRTAQHVGNDKELECLPYLAMFTAQQTWLPAWSASQTDILAEDWGIVE